MSAGLLKPQGKDPKVSGGCMRNTCLDQRHEHHKGIRRPPWLLLSIGVDNGKTYGEISN